MTRVLDVHGSLGEPGLAAADRALWVYVSESGRGWALALLAIAVYLPALAGGFVWDDWIFVTEPLIRRWDGIVSIWFSPAELKGERHYWPLVYTSFWIEHKVWGFRAAGYHAVNLLLHAANVLLVWRLLLRLRVPGAWLAAAVFAVHPIHVESVAWIIERKDLLSGLFYLLTVHVWLRHVDAPTAGRLSLCLCLFAVALLSKSIAVTLPAALLLLQWWRTGRVTWRDAGMLAPFFALALGIAVADLIFYRGRDEYLFDYSLVERALIAGRAVWAYVGQLAWPAELPVIYARWEVAADDPMGWLALGALGGLLALLWGLRHRIGRGALVAVCFFLLTIAPVLGFVDFSFMRIAFVADRFAYLASIGPIALAVGAAMRWPGRWSRGLGSAACVGLVGVLATLTWWQAEVYKNDLSLARHTVAVNPDQYFAQLRLAHQLVAAGEGEQALAAARRAVRLAQGGRGVDLRAVHRAVGSALLAQDRPLEAERELRRALASGPPGRHNDIRVQLAESLVRRGCHAAGLRAFDEVLEDDPASDIAYLGKGRALLEAGQWDLAAEAFRRALPVVRDPTAEPAIHRLLGQTLHKLDRLDDAAAHLDRALEIYPHNVWTLLARAAVAAARPVGEDDPARWLDLARERSEAVVAREPDNALAHLALGTVLLRDGAYVAARDALNEALRLARSPGTTRQAHRVLGEVLKAQGNLGEAATQYRRALGFHALDAEALEGLARLHFQAGRYKEALPLYRRLVQVTPHVEAARRGLAETLQRVAGDPEAAVVLKEDEGRELSGPGPESPRCPRHRSASASANL